MQEEILRQELDIERRQKYEHDARMEIMEERKAGIREKTMNI